MTNQERAEARYPMPDTDKYCTEGLKLDPDSKEFTELARELLDLQVIANKQQTAYIQGLEDAGEWMAISIAPLDRTLVDLWFEETGKKGKRIIDCEFLHGQWWYGTVKLEHYGQPTHWMPAAKPPIKAIK